MGFCSDWIPYIYHSHARLAPVLRSEDYLAKRVLCPKSSFLHGEHTTLELFDDVLVQRMNNTIVTRVEQLTNRHLGPLDYIPAVRNYWMPNVERVNHEQVSLFRLTYKVLCKTKITCNATHQYVLNNRIYPRPHFKFMAHTSPDAWQDAHDLFGAEELARLMTLRSYDAFLHAFGNTGSKRPHVVADCWTRHPEWPRLVLVGNPREMENYEAFRAKGWPPNVEFHEFVDVRTLRRLQIENGVALCSTAQEGYGHFINDGRSMGSVVLTTNHPPMNEFVREDGFDGILIGYDREPQHFDHQALWREFNSSVDISGTTVCDGVQRIISMSVEEKERMGGEARKSYELDTALMEANMKELLAEVWEHLQRDKSSLHRARYVY
ncbi:hypothetical protein BC830DRAFT_666732 [Chytriomyces sp. MP71]|nr:hypothetical protein BC830DRAFT_666732 [Chytriomyces sp. MP71]